MTVWCTWEELYFLGQAHLNHFDFTREADHFLEQIVERTHETAQMCLLNGRKYNVALMREGERAFRISSGVGRTSRSLDGFRAIVAGTYER